MGHVVREKEAFVDHGHGPGLDHQFHKGLGGLAVFGPRGLHLGHRDDGLEIVLDPVMDLAQKHFLFFQGGRQFNLDPPELLVLGFQLDLVDLQIMDEPLDFLRAQPVHLGKRGRGDERFFVQIFSALEFVAILRPSGTAEKNFSNAPRPPAEAPMPTTGKEGIVWGRSRAAFRGVFMDRSFNSAKGDSRPLPRRSRMERTGRERIQGLWFRPPKHRKRGISPFS